ncbi:MAG: FmdB family transcriptional regulator [Rhizobacter sp.]|nr:FmdB family transcriptional regulator [Rhizobacter sp.]
MPLYAYRCASCGHAQDHLQRMSDPLLTVCPVCGEPTYQKQVTAAGFQLKGSGWYVTDFREGAKPADKSGVAVPPPSSSDGKSETKSDGGNASGASSSGGEGASSAPAAAPAPAPAPAPSPPSSPSK